MKRAAHHRAINRTGPEHRFMARKALHLAKLMRPIRSAEQMLINAIPIRTGIYQIPPARISELRMAVEDALPYLRDSEGKVWE